MRLVLLLCRRGCSPEFGQRLKAPIVVRKTVVLRSVLPALAAALVLASYFGVPAGASQGTNGGRDFQCGYGYTQADKDENGAEHGNNNDTKAHGEDNDKCEDEADGEDTGGAAQGDGPIDVTQRAGEREGERGGGGG